MEAFALVILLLSGFRFATRFKFTQFKANRADGQRLYLTAAAWGTFLFFLSALLMAFLDRWTPLDAGGLNDWFAATLSLPQEQSRAYLPGLLGLSLSALLLAGIAPWFLNPLYAAMNRYGVLVMNFTSDEFDTIVMRSYSNYLPLLVITDNDMVIIGQPNDSFEPDRSDKSEITLSPEYLGYLDDNKEIVLHAAYDREELVHFYPDEVTMEDQLQIIIPKRHIVIFSMFDKDINEALSQSALRRMSEIRRFRLSELNG